MPLGEKKRLMRVTERDGFSPSSRAYRDRKTRLQRERRDRIFERDGYTCKSCGRTGSSETLHLAHITTALAFVRHAAALDAMDLSYRDDNLVTLCGACHKFQHRDLVSDFDPELKELLDRKEALKANPIIQEWLDLNGQIGQRMEVVRVQGVGQRAKVDRLFRQIKASRGWSGAAELIQKNKGVPTWGELGHVSAHRCREPGGGPAARKRVAHGLCTWHSLACAGTISRCKDCGLPYCEYHTPLHRFPSRDPDPSGQDQRPFH